MSIVRNQQSLFNLISDKLNLNSYAIEFRSDLFNSKETNYWYLDSNGIKKRFCPVMIGDVVGEYLNIPNSNSTTNSVSLQFDIFVGTETQSDKDIAEYADVATIPTFNAIEEFKNSLLAKYQPLGTPYLYMGGIDSTIDLDFTLYSPKTFYMKFVPYNIDNETLIDFTQSAVEFKITKETVGSTYTIRFYYTPSNYISIPYELNVEKEFVIYHDGTDWNIEDADGNSDSDTVTFVATDSVDAVVGGTTGLECLVKSFAFDDTAITSFDFTDVATEIDDWDYQKTVWSDKDNATNESAGLTMADDTINNCILWSEDGNAIFGFGTLNPISGLRSPDGTGLYQMFELEMSVFISNDVLFGNNFEYYIDGEQVYPIGREHTMSADLNGAQKIESNSNEFIAQETAREHTMSFYYIPSKKLNALLKHAVTGDTAQNTTYTLLVQYPFFQKSYDVILENGGTEPNINTLSTFTVTFKKADSNL